MSDKMISFDGVEISEDAILAKGFERSKDVREKFYDKWGEARRISEVWGTALKFEANDNAVHPACLLMRADSGPDICRAEDAEFLRDLFAELAVDMHAVEKEMLR